MREVRDRLIDDARKQGLDVSVEAGSSGFERFALTDASTDRTIEILGEALDKVVVSTRLEDENARLRNEVDELKKRLESRPSTAGRRRS